jgi:hypothetical protein
LAQITSNRGSVLGGASTSAQTTSIRSLVDAETACRLCAVPQSRTDRSRSTQVARRSSALCTHCSDTCAHQPEYKPCTPVSFSGLTTNACNLGAMVHQHRATKILPQATRCSAVDRRIRLHVKVDVVLRPRLESWLVDSVHIELLGPRSSGASYWREGCSMQGSTHCALTTSRGTWFGRRCRRCCDVSHSQRASTRSSGVHGPRQRVGAIATAERGVWTRPRSVVGLHPPRRGLTASLHRDRRAARALGAGAVAARCGILVPASLCLPARERRGGCQKNITFYFVPPTQRKTIGLKSQGTQRIIMSPIIA